MAITPESFVPELRRVGMANTAANAPNTSAEDHASYETPPAAHPLTGTNLPQSTGAGKGSIRTGIVRGGGH